MQVLLERALERRAEHARLAARQGSLTAALEAVSLEITKARGVLADEEQDVAKLESFSPTRIWAALRDTRLTDLDRERAERDAAAYAVAEAEARLATLQREADGLAAELVGYSTVEADLDAALRAKETWLQESGAPDSGELTEIGEERATLLARDKELMEAANAAVHARRLVATAEDQLRRARDWSNWDAFGGGGLFTDMMKYDRMDEAAGTLRSAGAALDVLSRELADVGMRVTAQLDVGGLDQAFDVWFDNIFSDLSVRSRVVHAHDAVRRVLERLVPLLGQLKVEIEAGAARLDELAARREALLGA